MTRILFSLSFLYCLTFIGLYPGWYDSGELVTGSFTLGLSHPPGQPFYTLLNHAFCTLFMFGTIAFRSAVFSCLIGLAAIYCAYKIITDNYELSKTQKTLIYISLLTLPSFALQITRIELYSLSFLLAILNIYLINSYIKRGLFSYLYLATFNCGLLFCVNTLIAFFQTLLLGIFCLHTLIKTYDKSLTKQVKKFLWLTLFFSLGFACNLYLIIRAQKNPDVMLMPIESFKNFIHFILAKPYARSFSIKTFYHNINHIGAFLKVILPYVLFVLPSFIFINFSKAFSKKTLLLLCFAIANAIPWSFMPYTFENPDTHGYISVFCFSIFIFSWHLLLHCQKSVPAWKKTYTLSLAIIIIIYQSIYFPKALNTNGSSVGKIISKFLKKSPYNSVSILTSDHWTFNYWYFQYVEQLKPDQWVLSSTLSRNKWYQKKYTHRLKQVYSTKIFEENETVKGNDLFLSSSYFDKEKLELIRYCQKKQLHDFNEIENTICTFAIAQWSKQFYRQNDILSAIQLLEKFYKLPISQNACPYPDNNFQSPFLLETSDPLFLPLPNHGLETLVYYYVLCNQFSKEKIDQILTMNPNPNTYLLLTQGIYSNASSIEALKFLEIFRDEFRSRPEQYNQATQWLQQQNLNR